MIDDVVIVDGDANLLTQIDGDASLSEQTDGDPMDVLEVGGAVTGVKGEAETDYRTGNVNLTRANLGIAEIETTDIDAVTEA